jgi:hypothetical protein
VYSLQPVDNAFVTSKPQPATSLKSAPLEMVIDVKHKCNKNHEAEEADCLALQSCNY